MIYNHIVVVSSTPALRVRSLVVVHTSVHIF